MSYPIHPDVEAAIALGHRLIDAYQSVVEMFDEVLSVKQSRDGMLQVAVTGGGKVDELFIADGALNQYRNEELETAILKLVDEATTEAFEKRADESAKALAAAAAQA